MGADHAPVAVSTLPVGRAFFADERGVVLRTTWHLERGFLNMSIWHDQLCVATFQLPVADAGRLASFLVEGLGEATANLLDERRQLPPPPLAAVAPSPSASASGSVAAAVADAIRQTAGAVAERIRRGRSASSD